MNYKIYRSSFTYIVIDDWLDAANYESFLLSAVNLIPYMLTSKVSNNGIVVTDKTSKSNKNLWLYPFYSQHPKEFNIARLFEQLLWSKEMQSILKETEDNLFQTALSSDYGQVMLSKYEEGDHYDWHRDYNPLFTANFMFAKEPLKFKGGAFEFGDWFSNSVKETVPFKVNRLILFPSRVYHRVTPIENFTGDNSWARFTLQYWPNFSQKNEY